MGKKIIVADDSRTVQKVVKLILEPSGYEVDCYDNIVETFDAIKASNPSIVFADVGISEMNGYDLGIRMQAEKKLRNIPLILLYGGFDEVNAAKFASSGARDKLSKPFDARQLIELVRKYVIMPDSNNDMPEVPTSGNRWDMESFDEEPPVPDLKEPLKIMESSTGLMDVDVNYNAVENNEENEEDEDFFKLDLNESIESLGIPEAHEIPFKKNYRTQDLSEDESLELMNEFNLVEEDDGTIKFKEGETDSSPLKSISENNAGLWEDKDYIDETFIVKDEPILGIAGLEDESEEILDADIKKLIDKKVEKIIREVVAKMLPDLAEKLVKEEIAKIVSGE